MSGWQWPRPRRAAFTVWRRNLLVWRKLLGPSLVAHLGEPLLFLLGLGFGLGAFIGDMAGMPYLAFVASGIVVSSAMNSATFEGLFSAYTRMVPQQTYMSMLTTPLEVDDVIGGEMLWCATKSMIGGVAVLTVGALLGAVAHWSAILALPVVFLTGLAFSGPALVMTAVSPGYDFFNYYVTLVLTPMFLFCGVFYPITVLPELMQQLVHLLPLFHAVELARPLVIGQVPDAIALHLAVLAAYAGVGYTVAVALVRRRLLV